MRHAALALILFAMLAGVSASPAEAASWSPYDRPAQYGVVDAAERSDHDVGRRRPERGRPSSRRARTLPGRRHANALQRRQWHRRRRERLLRGARLRARRRRRPRHRQLRRPSGTTFGPREQRDGYEVVEWAARSSRGATARSACTAPSYLAITQLFTAAQRPPHLKAIFPILPMGDGYRDIVFPGGQNNVGFIPFWLVLVSGSAPHPALVRARAATPPTWSAGSTTLASHAPTFAGFRRNFELDATGGEQAPTTGRSGRRARRSRSSTRSTVPTFVVGGLHDIFQRGEPLLYERLKQPRADAAADRARGRTSRLDRRGATRRRRAGARPDRAALVRPLPQGHRHERRRRSRRSRSTRYGDGALRDADRLARSAARAVAPVPPRRRRAERATAVRVFREAAGERSSSTPSPACARSRTSQWTAGLLEPVPCTTDNRLDEATRRDLHDAAARRRTCALSGPLFADLWVTTTAQ